MCFFPMCCSLIFELRCDGGTQICVSINSGSLSADGLHEQNLSCLSLHKRKGGCEYFISGIIFFLEKDGASHSGSWLRSHLFYSQANLVGIVYILRQMLGCCNQMHVT